MLLISLTTNFTSPLVESNQPKIKSDCTVLKQMNSYLIEYCLMSSNTINCHPIRSSQILPNQTQKLIAYYDTTLDDST